MEAADRRSAELQAARSRLLSLHTVPAPFTLGLILVCIGFSILLSFNATAGRFITDWIMLAGSDGSLLPALLRGEIETGLAALGATVFSRAAQRLPNTVFFAFDGIDGETLVLKNYWHIGFAADTPNGLVVPVIRDADKKDLYEIAKALGDLSARARSGKLSRGPWRIKQGGRERRMVGP